MSAFAAVTSLRYSVSLTPWWAIMSRNGQSARQLWGAGQFMRDITWCLVLTLLIMSLTCVLMCQSVAPPGHSSGKHWIVSLSSLTRGGRGQQVVWSLVNWGIQSNQSVSYQDHYIRISSKTNQINKGGKCIYMYLPPVSRLDKLFPVCLFLCQWQ